MSPFVTRLHNAMEGPWWGAPVSFVLLHAWSLCLNPSMVLVHRTLEKVGSL